MTCLESLPQELLDNIFNRCGDLDWKNFHLLSTTMAKTVKPFLFRKVHLYIDRQSIERVRKISLSDDLRHHVKHFILHSTVLPQFGNQSDWESLIDVRPDRSTWLNDLSQRAVKSSPESRESLAALYDRLPISLSNPDETYEEYCLALEAQLHLISELSCQDLISNLLLSFSRLQILEERPWSKDLKFETSPENEIMKWICLMTQKNSNYDNAEDRYEIEYERTIRGTGMYRSSILQNGLLGANIFLRYFLAVRDAGTSTPFSLELVSSVYSYNPRAGDDLDYVHQRWNEHYQTDHAQYLDLVTSSFQIFSSSTIANVTVLSLVVDFGWYPPVQEKMVLALTALLSTAASLENLCINTKNGYGDLRLNLFQGLQCITWPKLQRLELSGVTTTEARLRRLFDNHSPTLTSLSMDETCLDAGIESGTWESLLRDLPSNLTLTHFDLHPTYRDESGHEWGDYYWVVEHIRRYVLRQGTWPGMDGESIDVEVDKKLFPNRYDTCDSSLEMSSGECSINQIATT